MNNQNQFSIEGWIINDLCNPAKIPETLINREYLDTINEQVTAIGKEIASDIVNADVVAFVESLEFLSEEGEYKWEYENTTFSIPYSKLLKSLSEEQMQALAKIKDGGEAKVGALLYALYVRDVEFFDGNMTSFNYPTSSPYYMIAKRNLNTIFKEVFGKIPYLRNKGNRGYEIVPVNDPIQVIPQSRSVGRELLTPIGLKREGTNYSNVLVDNITIFSAFGKERAELLLQNLRVTCQMAEEAEEQELLTKLQFEKWGDDYTRAQEELPELLEFAKGLDAKHTGVNFEKKVAVFLEKRSHYGGSGGIARQSVITVWANGQSESRQYQYKDQYTWKKDNPSNDFKSLEVISIEEGEQIVSIKVKAIAYNGDHKEESFELKVEGKEALEELSIRELALFKTSVEQQVQEALNAVNLRIEGNTRRAPDCSGYIPWEAPYVKDKCFTKSGIAAFSLVEAIDYGSPIDITMKQERCTLYFMIHEDQELSLIVTDHAWVVPVDHPFFDNVKHLDEYGDPIMSNISINGDVISYLHRGVMKEFSLKQPAQVSH